MDCFWNALGKMPRPDDTREQRFPHIVRLAKAALVLPHSNADPERLFSMVKKIETSQRGHLLPTATCDLISCKYNNPVGCFDSAPLMTSEALKRAKGATMASLSAWSAAVAVHDGGTSH